jgi:hypothetical protein
MRTRGYSWRRAERVRHVSNSRSRSFGWSPTRRNVRSCAGPGRRGGRWNGTTNRRRFELPVASGTASQSKTTGSVSKRPTRTPHRRSGLQPCSSRQRPRVSIASSTSVLGASGNTMPGVIDSCSSARSPSRISGAGTRPASSAAGPLVSSYHERSGIVEVQRVRSVTQIDDADLARRFVDASRGLVTLDGAQIP